MKEGGGTRPSQALRAAKLCTEQADLTHLEIGLGRSQVRVPGRVSGAGFAPFGHAGVTVSS